MSENQPCPIWRTPVNITEKYQDAACIDSPRAGGKYAIKEPDRNVGDAGATDTR